MGKIIKLMFLALVFIVVGCSNNEMAILIEQPVAKELDNKSIIIKVNDKKIYDDVLVSTNVASKYKEALYDVKNAGEYKLQVLIDGKSFDYIFDFPSERHIIISPSFNHNKVGVGIIKQAKKFILH